MMQEEKTFKITFPLEKRKEMCLKMTEGRIDHVPIICEKNRRSTLSHLPKAKFVVSNDLKIGQFIHYLRASVILDHSTALFLFARGKDLIQPNMKMSEIYAKYNDEDGFLYFEYYEHSSFG